MIRIVLVAMIIVLPAGCTSIQQAAREGDIEHIKTLLALGVNINSRTYFGDQGSALHRASSAGQTETVKFLIEKGANVNIKGVRVAFRHISSTSLASFTRQLAGMAGEANSIRNQTCSGPKGIKKNLILGITDPCNHPSDIVWRICRNCLEIEVKLRYYKT